MDFGASKANIDRKLSKNFKSTLVGTPMYLSPDLMRAYLNQNFKEVKHDLEKSDVYSLGIMFL